MRAELRTDTVGQKFGLCDATAFLSQPATGPELLPVLPPAPVTSPVFTVPLLDSMEPAAAVPASALPENLLPEQAAGVIAKAKKRILEIVPISVSLLQFVFQLSKEYAWVFGSKSMDNSGPLTIL